MRKFDTGPLSRTPENTAKFAAAITAPFFSAAGRTWMNASHGIRNTPPPTPISPSRTNIDTSCAEAGSAGTTPIAAIRTDMLSAAGGSTRYQFRFLARREPMNPPIAIPISSEATIPAATLSPTRYCSSASRLMTGISSAPVAQANVLAATMTPISRSRPISRSSRTVSNGPDHGKAACGEAAVRRGTPRLSSTPRDETQSTTIAAARRPAGMPATSPPDPRPSATPEHATPARIAAVTTPFRMALAVGT